MEFLKIKEQFEWNKKNKESVENGETLTLEKNQIELLKKKFIEDGDDKARLFLEEVLKWLKDHDKNANEHKQAYFSNNMKVGRAKSVKIGVEEIFKIIEGLFYGISFTVAFKWILAYGKEKFGSIYEYIVIGCLIVMVFIFSRLFFIIGVKQKELKLRQYGETWIRHRCVWWELKQEMMMYLYELGVYSEKTDLMQKQLFMERMIEIENADMKQFQKNMQDIQEVME